MTDFKFKPISRERGLFVRGLTHEELAHMRACTDLVVRTERVKCDFDDCEGGRLTVPSGHQTGCPHCHGKGYIEKRVPGPLVEALEWAQMRILEHTNDSLISLPHITEKLLLINKALAEARRVMEESDD